MTAARRKEASLLLGEVHVLGGDFVASHHFPKVTLKLVAASSLLIFFKFLQGRHLEEQ